MRSCSMPITTAQNGSFQPIGSAKGVSRITRSTTAPYDGPTVAAAAAVSLLLLKTGRYHGAANLITAVASVAVTAGLFAKVNRDAYAGYTTFIYFMIALIVQSMLFCERKWIFGFTALFFISDISFFFLVKDRLDPISLKAAKVGMVDSGFVIIFTFILSYLVLRITEQAITKSDEERKRSDDSYAKIGGLLEQHRGPLSVGYRHPAAVCRQRRPAAAFTVS